MDETSGIPMLGDKDSPAARGDRRLCPSVGGGTFSSFVGTKEHVLLVPQSHQRINSGRSPCRRIAGENRGA
jgi:hypothetical protein